MDKLRILRKRLYNAMYNYMDFAKMSFITKSGEKVQLYDLSDEQLKALIRSSDERANGRRVAASICLRERKNIEEIKKEMQKIRSNL